MAGALAIMAIMATGLLDAATRLAFTGKAIALFNIPHAEPILIPRAYSLSDYERMARFGAVVSVATLFTLGLASWLVASTSAWKAGLFSRFRLASVADLLFLGLFTVSAWILFKNFGFEGSWAKIDDIINLTADPPYVQRQLLPSVARLLKIAAPGLTSKQAFEFVQFGVIVALFFSLRTWGRAAAGAVGSFAAPALFLMTYPLWATYFTFYDLAIVLFFSLGLLFLWRGRVLPYLIVVSVATLNHEVILFLILISGFLLHPFSVSARYDYKFVAAQVGIHIGIRSLVFWLVPAERVAALGNIWINLHFLSHPYPALSHTLGLFLFFGICALGLARSPSFIRVSWLLLPLLIGSTLLVGSINETRQFVAFIPVAVVSAVYACAGLCGMEIILPEKLTNRESEAI
jgi:hypothetical protein